MIMHKSKAVIDGDYRYSLTREWSGYTLTWAKFIMLNPSTADAIQDDATIRRCIGFAKAWGCDGLVVANLFGLMATNPKQLYTVADPVGPGNDTYIATLDYYDGPLVCAWGTHGGYRGRDRVVYEIVRKQNPQCLKFTKDGHPHHPLRLPKSTILQPFVI